MTPLECRHQSGRSRPQSRRNAVTRLGCATWMRSSRCKPLRPVSRHQGASVLTWRCRLIPCSLLPQGKSRCATRCIGACREDFSEREPSSPRTRASATSASTRAAGALCDGSNHLPRPHRVLRLRRRHALRLFCSSEHRAFVSGRAGGVTRSETRLSGALFRQTIAIWSLFLACACPIPRGRVCDVALCTCCGCPPVGLSGPMSCLVCYGC